MKCYICGKDYNKADLEEVFTGKAHVICYKCQQLGNKEVDGRRARYFSTYEGKKRTQNN